MDWFSGLCSAQSNNQMKTTGGSQSDNWNCCDPSRPMGSAPAQMQAANSTAGAERAGIGIILALHPDGSLYVHTVCPGGSAEGSLQPGDVLMKIGAEEVFRAPAPYVAELLLGPPGTEIELWVRRARRAAGAGAPQSRGQDEGSFGNHQYRLKRKRTDPQLARKAIREAFEEHSNNV